MAEKRVRIDTSFPSKKKCTERYFGDDDRISQLTDEILVDILSLLSLKEAARTSVLSSRWINLWKHTQSLCFDAYSVLEKIDKQPKILKSERSKYVKWVNYVLRSHKSLSLKEFKICFPLNKSSRKAITWWLEFAFSRKVQRLELDLENYEDRSKGYCFPNELLTLSSCRTSKLQPLSDSNCINHPRMLVDFKSLKALFFRCVGVTDQAIEFFLDNCPLLEKLTVHLSNKVSKLEICGSSLMLKHLEIVFCLELESLKVSAPRLTTLIVTSLDGLLLDNVPMLVNVFVGCPDKGTAIQNLFKVLSCCISQLQTLTLELHKQGFIGELDELCELPEMPKLKKLVVVYRARGDESLVRLAALIRASPYLEEFELQLKWFSARNDREVKAHMRFPHHHLKVFKFIGYFGSTNDVELLSYMLENCVALEKMIIDTYCVSFPELAQSAREIAKRKLPSQIPQHVKLVIV